MTLRYGGYSWLIVERLHGSVGDRCIVKILLHLILLTAIVHVCHVWPQGFCWKHNVQHHYHHFSSKPDYHNYILQIYEENFNICFSLQSSIIINSLRLTISRHSQKRISITILFKNFLVNLCCHVWLSICSLTT